jgi:hypothetical protein
VGGISANKRGQPIVLTKFSGYLDDLRQIVQGGHRLKVMNAPNRRNRKMTTPVVTKQQKDLKNWLKLRTKRAAAVAAKPLKHGKKSST